MTAMTITPPAGSAELEELRALVRAVRLQRHIDDAAAALRQAKNNPDLAADMTGLPLGFVLRVASWLGVSVGEREDIRALVGWVTR
jgi:hypothetical protein